MAHAYVDTLTDTNGTTLQTHTGEAGAGLWTKSVPASADSIINSNQISHTGNSSVYVWSPAPLAANALFEVRFRRVTPQTGVGGPQFMLGMRAPAMPDNAGNGEQNGGYRAYLSYDAAGAPSCTINIVPINGKPGHTNSTFGFTSVAGSSLAAINDGLWHKLGFLVMGSQLTLLIDDVIRATTSNASWLANGFIYFSYSNSGTSAFELDDFAVTDIDTILNNEQLPNYAQPLFDRDVVRYQGDRGNAAPTEGQLWPRGQKGA